MFFDTDCGGVVHNLAYLRFVEIARTLLADQLGLPLAEMAETRKYPVVVRARSTTGAQLGSGTNSKLKDGSTSFSGCGFGAHSKSLVPKMAP